VTVTSALVVPDASVILKWALPAEDEPHAEQAMRLRDQFLDGEISFVVPPLWRYEAGNTLARKYPEHAFELMEALQGLGMHEPEPSTSWLEQACRLAGEYRVAFYDAAYHALAIVQRSVLVTADEAYLRKVAGGQHIRHISDWQ